MRSTHALAATATLSLLLAGCGLNSSPSATTPSPGAGADGSTSSSAAAGGTEMNPELNAILPADIKADGVIDMATQAAYPPFGFMADDGKTIEGLDIDLANAIGDKLGVEVKVQNTSFDAIIPSLEAKKVDMAMASIGDTKEREKVIDFATYYWNGTVIMVKKGNPKGIKADLACDATIGVIRGSLQQTAFLPAHDPKCEAEGRTAPVPQVFQDGPQAQLALSAGRIDGVMQDAPPLADQVSKNPDALRRSPARWCATPTRAAWPSRRALSSSSRSTRRSTSSWRTGPTTRSSTGGACRTSGSTSLRSTGPRRSASSPLVAAGEEQEVVKLKRPLIWVSYVLVALLAGAELWL